MLVIEKQGQVIQMFDLSLSCLSPRKPEKRGKITEFTSASRRRLIDLCSRLDVKGTDAKFLTLTFSGFPTPDKAKVIFQTFLKRLHRKYPRASAVWRVEMQKRGSPHFHLIIFNMPYTKQPTLQKWWEQCTHEPESTLKNYKRCEVLCTVRNVFKGAFRKYVKRSRVWIQRLQNHKQVMYYVSKYVAKTVRRSEITLLDNGSYLTEPFDIEKIWKGRHWGIFNKKDLPMAKREVAIVRDAQFARHFWHTVHDVANGHWKVSDFSAKLYTSYAETYFSMAKHYSDQRLCEPNPDMDNLFMASRSTRKRIQKFFRITAR